MSTRASADLRDVDESPSSHGTRQEHKNDIIRPPVACNSHEENSRLLDNSNERSVYGGAIACEALENHDV